MPGAGVAMRVDIRHKSFGTTPVLGPVAFTVAPGEILAVTGPSGIGKTTLLRIVAGLDREFEGEVAEVGRVGMVFQEPTLLPWRTALGNLTLVTGCGRDEAASALEEVGLGAYFDAFPNTLSLGQQRRLALARAMVVAPATLLLDEAFVSLDDETARRMRRLAQRLLERRSPASLLVTHDLGEMAMLADRVLYLDGKPASILGETRISGTDSGRDEPALSASLRSWLASLRPAATSS